MLDIEENRSIIDRVIRTVASKFIHANKVYDKDDLVQECWIAVMNSASSYDPSISRVTTWVWHVSSNCCCTLARRGAKGRQCSLEDIDAEQGDSDLRMEPEALGIIQELASPCAVEYLKGRLLGMSHPELSVSFADATLATMCKRELRALGRLLMSYGVI